MDKCPLVYELEKCLERASNAKRVLNRFPALTYRLRMEELINRYVPLYGDERTACHWPL